MLWNNAFIYTLREVPSEAETISHKLMLRAGMIQKLAAGIYNYLPPGLRVIRKIEAIIRSEMTKSGATELLMPVVIPAELWKESGRWDYYGPELLRFTDRKQNDFCLGPTHEEVIVDVVRRTVRSYRNLPLCLYQIQTKFRDEVRPRYGLMRGREFIMKDAYSFHADDESLDTMYWTMHNAYTNIFRTCGLNFRPVEADSGNIGGSMTHEFHVLADSGEDTIAFCDTCDYAANVEKATARETIVDAPASSDALLPMEEVATPDKKSIEEVSAFLNIPPEKTVKMLLYRADGEEKYIAVCIRGDLTVNEIKLRVLLGAQAVTVPEEADVRKATGLPVGYIGACNLAHPLIREVIADTSVRAMNDCVCGANKEGFHYIHVAPGRDMLVARYADVHFVAEGDGCPQCAGTLKLRKGIEVGQVFKLGRKYAKPMKLTFLSENNAEQEMTMGCYGIGVGRTAAAAVEQNYDNDGIIWPIPIAPYTVALLCLDTTDADCMAVAQGIHDELETKGVDVLFDDRAERPGIKFKDADLIGCPIRVTVGARGLKEGIVELKLRSNKEVQKISKETVVSAILDIIKINLAS